MRKFSSFMHDESCKTVYPIVMIHGAGFRDLKPAWLHLLLDMVKK